jgi:hypothetical protein
MNIYLTENYEITNFVWAKAEHWWPMVIPVERRGQGRALVAQGNTCGASWPRQSIGGRG